MLFGPSSHVQAGLCLVRLCLVRAAQSDAMLTDASLLMPSASPLNVFKDSKAEPPNHNSCLSNTWKG